LRLILLPTQTQAKKRGRPPKKLTNGDALDHIDNTSEDDIADVRSGTQRKTKNLKKREILFKYFFLSKLNYLN
jgi:hypothetical protein